MIRHREMCWRKPGPCHPAQSRWRWRHGRARHRGCCRPPAPASARHPAPNPLNGRFLQRFVTVLTCANLVPLPVAFPSKLPVGCFIFNTCSAPEFSHRLLRSLVTTPVVLFLPGAEKCQHSTENFNVPTVQLYLLKSPLHH